MRASWDRTFLDVAEAVARRSECTRSQVGAVVVDREHRIVATGYNGKPERLKIITIKGKPLFDDCRSWCIRGGGHGLKEDCPSIHAEANALLWGDRRAREGGRIYITRVPCRQCSKLIANSGLHEVVWLDDPEDEDRRDDEVWFLRSSGMLVRSFWPKEMA